ncbi:MAG TPA: biotin-dependent carboxyltransferase family protein [Acidimicrobiales bacterium]|nr:biotin-dependent carboxyltransferase family protein [Acidimicrobiales bacterium]
MTDRLEIIATGPLTTVQDRGRAGHAHEGVPPSGAADRPAHALGNRLVGNLPGAAALEVTLGGLRVRLGGRTTRAVALTGAPASLTVAGRAAPLLAPVLVRPGDTVEVGVAASGLRSYLAVAGGIDVAAELGSRSTDVLSGLGPPPVAAGDALPLGAPVEAPAVDAAPAPPLPSPVGVLPGPRDDWLAGEGWEALTGAAWTVTAASNRVGVRLSGPPLRLRRSAPLAPEGIVTGAVQLPPGGQPIVFLADHPVTGGYPVVAVVDEAAVPALAQARPGDTLRFALVNHNIRT